MRYMKDRPTYNSSGCTQDSNLTNLNYPNPNPNPNPLNSGT